MVSVALTTYNGEKYLAAQLASLESQSLMPSEILVCDDGSTDNTKNIIFEFQKRSEIPLRLIENESRLGFVQNSRKAMMLCNYEFISFCDQDDIWVKEKLEKQVAYLDANPEMKAVFTDLVLADENLNLTGETFWTKLGFSKKLQRSWENGNALNILIRKGNYVTGAALMIRKSFRDKLDHILSIPSRFWAHDGLIALTAANMNAIGMLSEPTVIYRQHEMQRIGTKPVGLLTKQKNNPAAELRDIIEYRNELVILGINETRLGFLDSKIRHFRTRVNLPANKAKRIFPVLKEFFMLRYLWHSSSFLSQPFNDLMKRSSLRKENG